MGRARPQVRRAPGGEALQRGRQPAALPHQPPRRAQPARQVDAAGGALQRAAPLGARPLALDPARRRQLQGGAALLRRDPRLLQGGAHGVRRRGLGQGQLHGHQAGDHQGDDARVRRSGARGRRAGSRAASRAGRAPRALGGHGASSSATRASTSAFPPRARSSAWRACIAIWRVPRASKRRKPRAPSRAPGDRSRSRCSPAPRGSRGCARRAPARGPCAARIPRG